MTIDEIRELLAIEEAARGALTVSDWAYQKMLSYARHSLRPLCEQLLTITAERDALRQRVAELEQRLADLTRMVVAAEVEDDA